MKQPFQSVLVFRTLDSDKEILTEEILEVAIELYEEDEEGNVSPDCVEETVKRKFFLNREEKWKEHQQKILEGAAEVEVYVRDFM